MATKRERIDRKDGAKRYVRKDAEGKFTENQASVGKSLAADRKKKAKKTVPKGQGDRGDQAPSKRSAGKRVSKKAASKKATSKKAAGKKPASKKATAKRTASKKARR